MGGRFKLDENLPRDAEALLREAGHEVETVLGERLGGNPDPKVFDACRAEGRILITLDLDFADTRFYPSSTHPGIWVLRPPMQSTANVIALSRPPHILWFPRNLLMLPCVVTLCHGQDT